MHAAFFSLKRMHWSAYKASRPFTAPYLPPSRYDMLRLVGMYQDAGRPLVQVEIALRLGICQSVVSRTLARSEELGLVIRVAHEDDRRYRIVLLTPMGRGLVESVLVESGEIEGMAARAMLPIHGGNHGCNLSAVYERFNHTRYALGDQAPFLHPWRVTPLYEEGADGRYREIRIRCFDVEDRVDGCVYVDDGEEITFDAQSPRPRKDRESDYEWTAFRVVVANERARYEARVAGRDDGFDGIAEPSTDDLDDANVIDDLDGTDDELDGWPPRPGRRRSRVDG